MKIKLENNDSLIQDTASWMAWCRATCEQVSKDVLAKLWLNDAAWEKHRDYTTSVAPSENMALSLRARFFLENISEFLEQNPDSVFINIWAGFSSYPFLMPESWQYIEVDTHENIWKKQYKIELLNKQNLLPERDIKFYWANLDNSQEVIKLFENLTDIINWKKSYVLFEWLIYYLSKESTQNLFSQAKLLQTSESKLGVVSWAPEAIEYPSYKRFKEYFIKHHWEAPPDLVCHDINTFKHISWYNLIEQTDYIETSKKFWVDKILTKYDDVFWETLSVLKRK